MGLRPSKCRTQVLSHGLCCAPCSSQSLALFPRSRGAQPPWGYGAAPPQALHLGFLHMYRVVGLLQQALGWHSPQSTAHGFLLEGLAPSHHGLPKGAVLPNAPPGPQHLHMVHQSTSYSQQRTSLTPTRPLRPVPPTLNPSESCLGNASPSTQSASLWGLCHSRPPLVGFRKGLCSPPQPHELSVPTRAVPRTARSRFPRPPPQGL